MLDIRLVMEYAGAHQAEWLGSLQELLSIPTVSMLPEHAPDMQAAAEWLARYMRDMGMARVDVLPTGGHPVVFGEWLTGEAGAPTLLAYGHYDVQPVDPLSDWRSAPFEPTIAGDDLFCRGASDDKGQLFAVLAAAESFLQTEGSLPIDLKILLEGEEELSSPHMAGFVAAHRQRLAADAVLICDEALLDSQTPLIVYGVRGNIYLEVTVQGPAQDLHSGTFGGAVDNPFNVLVRLLAQLQDGRTRRVTIPGFYDRVQPLGEAERALMARVPVTDEAARRLAGVGVLAGEEGYTTLERVSVRPTLEIHGLPGGFTGAGKKTVIPARAGAKVSMRLVPDQDPHEIARLFEAYMRSLAPPTVELGFQTLGASRPAVIDYEGTAVQLMARALEQSFGGQTAYLRGGGSEAIIRELQEALGVPIVLTGFGLPDDNIHAPNEKLHLPNLFRGIEALIRYCALFGAMSSGKR